MPSDVEDSDRREILESVAQQLIVIRTRLGYDLDIAATLAHVDPERLAEAEEASITLDEAELQGLADAYGVDISAFFGGRITPFSYLAGA
jgi:hypothetical protein